MPRKLSDAAHKMRFTAPRVYCTIIGARAFGRICLVMMRRFPAPMERAASTYS